MLPTDSRAFNLSRLLISILPVALLLAVSSASSLMRSEGNVAVDERPEISAQPAHVNRGTSAMANSAAPVPTSHDARPQAASPSMRSDAQEPACPSGKCAFQKGRVLIKLTAQIRLRDQESNGAWTEDAALNAALAAQGVLRLEPIFVHARPPKPGETIPSPQGSPVAKPDLTRWQRAVLSDAGADESAVAKALSQAPGLVWVELDYLRRPAGARVSVAESESLPASQGKGKTPLSPPTDPLFGQQWHLPAINAQQAWDYLESQGLPPGGSRDVIVAVIDTGVDYTHPDLAANMWTNSLEIPGNGIDDDGNGYVDDVHGVDVITNSGNPADDHGHGTHVAGIIAAQANNGRGGVGVAYNVQVMAIKAAQYSGVLAASDIAEAIYYAAAQGADVINMSFGGYARSQVEEDALAVGFSQAVLVAAAGNDSKVNLPCYRGQDFYPAAYTYVLGVMAHTRLPDAQGDFLAGFSNFDCTPQDTHEYELMSPGEDIWSTLPGDQYAAWDGTSMAAPIVSGIAALVRTKFADRNAYSSRFIMGQLASTGAQKRAYTTAQGAAVYYHAPDAYAALTSLPNPNLSYEQNWLFDPTSLSAANDNDDIIDAGETIDLGIAIRNHWGGATGVTVTLAAIAEGASLPDPYVTMLISSVDYGAVGSFTSDDNGLIYDAQGRIIGVQNPFRFSVDPSTPNNHIIPFLLTITAHNGLNPGDPTLYTFQSRFTVMVQRGVQVFGEIAQDTTWTADKLYIVVANTLVPEGVTLTIEPGTTIAFADGTFLVVRGNLIAVGTKNQRITFTSNSLTPHNKSWAGITFFADVTLYYCDFSYSNPALIHWAFVYAGQSVTVSNCQITNCYKALNMLNGDGSILIEHNKFENIYYGLGRVGVNGGPFRLINNLFNNIAVDTYYPSRDTSAIPILSSGGLNHEISGNSLLNNYFDVGVSDSNINNTYDLTNNYWGTTDPLEISAHILDYYDDFWGARVNYQPFLTQPSPDAPASVSNIAISPPSPVGVGAVTFTVTFSTDMDTSVQPLVAFGPLAPYTDYVINGTWTGVRTWQGSFNVTPLTGDGNQIIYVSGAVGLVDGMTIPIDTTRHFEIITSGTASLNLQATGGEGRVDLMWTQDDFDLLAGYNLYRATSSDGVYTRLNSGLIPASQHAYTDTAVQPGQPYFYKFTVVKTDMTESGFSNIASATPLDTIAPVITHTPVTTAPPGLSLTLFADVTDNVSVQAVTLFFRAIGATSYTNRAMLLTTGHRYSATLAGSLVTSPGLEYYIEATDGVSTVRSGRPEEPYRITVVDRPVATTVTPNHGPTSGGTAVTIAGSNFKVGATVKFGDAAASNVTVASSNQITCTTPPHFPAVVDVIVTNPDTQAGTLLHGFTYESDTASLSMPNSNGGQGAIVQIPINAANIQGLAAGDLLVTFDGTVLSAQTAHTGTLTPGWSLAVNTGTPGQVQLSMASPGGTSTGSGTLAVIEFNVVGAPASTSTLHIASASLNGGAIPVQMADGAFTVNQVYSISGAARYWNGGAGLPGVGFTLSGDRVYGGSSDASGAYSINGVQAGAYTLTPSKSDGVTGISALDASLVLQHAAGLTTLSGAAATAADVDKSGSINSLDAFYILQNAVGLIGLPFPGAGVVWEFSPPSRAYAALGSNQTGQDFTGLLLGDVSGNWTAPSAPQVSDATLSLPEVSVRPGGQTTLLLALELNQAQVYGVDIRILYDPSVVSVLAVDGGNAVSDWLLAKNLGTPGQIRVSLAGTRPLTSGGEMLCITLRATGSSGSNTLLTIGQGSLNEGNVASALQNGRLTITEPASAPMVSEIAPPSGATAGRSVVTIKGANFQEGSAVTIGGVAATVIKVSDANTLTAATEAHAAGIADVVVTNPDGQSGTMMRGYIYSDASTCPYTLARFSQAFDTSGGESSVSVIVPNGCSWIARSNDSWISITSSDSGSGSDIVTFVVRDNFDERFRIGTMSIAGRLFIVRQRGLASEGCTVRLSPIYQSFPVNGGSGSLYVIADEECIWAAASGVSWVTITSTDTGGIGSGTIQFTVGPNMSGAARKGLITINGQTFTVKQKGS